MTEAACGGHSSTHNSLSSPQSFTPKFSLPAHLPHSKTKTFSFRNVGHFYYNTVTVECSFLGLFEDTWIINNLELLF